MSVAATPTRTVVVPDLDGELLATLGQLEELLLMLPGDEDGDELPEPFAHDEALGAIRRIRAALRPTQRLVDDAARPGRLLAPDGRYEHIPLTPVELDEGDLSLLGSTARALGAAARFSVLGETLDDAAAIDPHKTPAALVEGLARLHGVLDLELTDDARALLPKLRAGVIGEVVLTPTEDAAYNRTVDRINTTWSGSALDRWAY
jgi:hypothetical protein